MGRYDHIINQSRPASAHPKMSALKRAAQFSAFEALAGLNEQMDETARLVDGKVELLEDEIAELNRKFARLAEILDKHDEYPEVELTYFVPDDKKNGGAYVTKAVNVKRIDGVFRKVVLSDKSEINIADILDFEIM